MSIKEVPLSLGTLADGLAEEKFSQAFAQLVEDFAQPNVDGKRGQIVLTIEVDHLGDGAFIAKIRDAKVKRPATKAEGRVVRLREGVPVVDIEELGEDKNRRLPFVVADEPKK